MDQCKQEMGWVGLARSVLVHSHGLSSPAFSVLPHSRLSWKVNFYAHFTGKKFPRSGLHWVSAGRPSQLGRTGFWFWDRRQIHSINIAWGCFPSWSFCFWGWYFENCCLRGNILVMYSKAISASTFSCLTHGCLYNECLLYMGLSE